MTEVFDLSRKVPASFAYTCLQLREKAWGENPSLLEEVTIYSEASKPTNRTLRHLKEVEIMEICLIK